MRPSRLLLLAAAAAAALLALSMPLVAVEAMEASGQTSALATIDASALTYADAHMDLEAEAEAEVEAEAESQSQSGTQMQLGLVSLGTAGPAIRGVWVAKHRTRGYNEASAPHIQDGVKALTGIGFNRLYWDSYTNGMVHFACPECNQLVGAPIAAQTKGDANDQLSVVLAAAQGKASVVAWFEYSFLVQSTKLPSNPVYLWAKKNKLLLMQRGQEFVEKNHKWLDARKPQAQQLVIAMMCAALKNYPALGGVQQDDHFGFPVKGVGRQSAAFTTIAKSIMTKVRACAGKGQILSLAPSPIGQARDEYNVNWHTFGKMFDEYVPQTYLSTSGYMRQVGQQRFSGMPRFIPAIAADHGGKVEPWSNIQRQLNELKKAGLPVSFWCDIAVRNEKLREPLTKYFGGGGGGGGPAPGKQGKQPPPNAKTRNQTQRPTTNKQQQQPGSRPKQPAPRPKRLFHHAHAAHLLDSLKQRAQATQPDQLE